MTPPRPAAFRRPIPGLLLTLCCTTALCPAAVMAQETATGTTTAAGVVTLDPITVEGNADDDARDIVAVRSTTGNKMETDALASSSSVSVVTQKEIETRGADTLEDVLAYTSGVSVDEWGGGDDRYDAFRIRGFDALSLGTYRDGLAVRGFGWTFGKLEPYGLERVEILKGSNSSLFGLNAPGGLINAVTKTPKSEPFGEAYTTLGDHHLEFGTDFGGKLDKDGVWTYRVTAKRQDGEKTYDHSNDDRAYVAAALSWRPSAATELTFMWDYNNRHGVPGLGFPEGVDIDRETFLGEPDFNRVDTIQRDYGYRFSHDFGNGLTFRQAARYSTFDMTYEQVYGASTDPAADRESFAVYSDSEQFAIDNQLQFDSDLGWAKSRSLIGVEYSWIKVDETALYGTADGIDIYDPSYCGRGCVHPGPYIDWEPEQETKSVYIQQELTFADRWIATLGGRYDSIGLRADYPATGTRESRDFESFTSRAGLTYRISPTTSVYANYSESFTPDVWAIANDPQEGTQYEVGVKYRPAGIDALFTAAVFDLTQSNVSKQVSPTTYRQIGEINVKGIELEAKLAMTDRLNLTAAYSYWDGEITEDGIEGNKGNRPSFVPEQIASIWADYTLPGAGPGRAGDTTLGLGLRYTGSSYGDDANTARMGAHTLVDAAISHQLRDNVALSLRATNLFDEEYVSAYYYGTTYYGDGREVTATLRYTW